MKLVIEAGEDESLAKSIPDVIAALLAAAIVEGGSKDDLRETIAKAIGASSITKTTTHDPKWAFIRESNDAASELYAGMMARCTGEIVTLLEEASEGADRSRYLERVKPQ